MEIKGYTITQEQCDTVQTDRHYQRAVLILEAIYEYDAARVVMECHQRWREKTYGKDSIMARSLKETTGITWEATND